MKTCNRCKESKVETEFRRKTDCRNGLSPSCKSCELSYQREYRKTEKGKANRMRYWRSDKGKAVQKRLESKPERAARRAIYRATSSGVISRPDACSCCGAVAFVQAHHHNGYDQKHHLDVAWLCNDCHKVEHGKVVA